MPTQSDSGPGHLASVAAGVARMVRIAAWAAVAIIVTGILLVVLKANPSNGIVSAIHDFAHTLITPFAGMFKLHNPRMGVAVNWGIAALVYLIAGYLLARLIAMVGTIGLRHRRETP